MQKVTRKMIKSARLILVQCSFVEHDTAWVKVTKKEMLFLWDENKKIYGTLDANRCLSISKP